MTDRHRCGDSGGRTATGKPCRRTTASGERCPQHPEGRRVTLGDGTVAMVLDETGRVDAEGGHQSVDEIGLVLRMGLADVSPEVAEQYFPAMELLPEEERPGPGEVVEGVPVFCWIQQAHAAQLVGKTARHLQNLEDKGLPNVGNRSSKRYPLPHLFVWYDQYHQEIERRGRCRSLRFRVAWARHQLELEEESE